MYAVAGDMRLRPWAPALLGPLLLTPVAIATASSPWGGVALACATVSAPVGWALGDKVGRRHLGWSALAFGVSVTVIALFAYLCTTFAQALQPGAAVPRAETPLGYFLMSGLTVVALTPILAPPISAIGLVWAALVRRSASTVSSARR